MSEAITSEVIAEHGLSTGEYADIQKILGRDPNLVELGIFSVMWSEHCSYKSSKPYLKKLPTKGKAVICGPGENAGVVDIGDGLCIVFKMESHNHPSFIEPYQGAATGVGGILRDVFTMGARPIALLNSLRFGAPDHPKTPYLVHGVVAGIAGYGNCMGIPTIGGEVFFDPSYNGNILVNAFCLGLAKKSKIFLAKAKGLGNPVIYVGSKTGRDGIHGATMASDSFGEGGEERRPTVQCGDPFTEKLLMEACLEMMSGKDVVGIQDMGAAGLTCSSLEMAAKGRVGVDLHLDKVPLRETGMTPYEIMLSESQERMLLVAKKGTEKKIKKLFEKWDLDAAVVGQVVKGGRLRIFMNEKPVGELPAQTVEDHSPVYERPIKKPAQLERLHLFSSQDLEEPADYNGVLKKLLASPNIASKEWVYRQYDHMVGTDTVVLPGSDAGVLRLKGTKKGLAMTVDCNSRYCYLDPYEGAKLAVAEAARNLVCSGAKPLAVTDCLNFGNPEVPEVMWQFQQAVAGISEACKAFGTPVVSGNVSFYNETRGQSIFPTPTIAMVGLLNDVRHHCTQWFKKEGDLILLLGETFDERGGSEYLKILFDKTAGRPPRVDLRREKKVHQLCFEAIQKGLLHSAHDCSEGGLAVALAESCFGPQKEKLGAVVDLKSDLIPSAALFSESQSRIIVSLAEKQLPKLLKLIRKHACPYEILGFVKGSVLKIGNWIEEDVAELEELWSTAFNASCLDRP